MGRTVVIKLPLACVNQVYKALKKRMEKVTYSVDESAEDNYVNSAEFAYLECAISIIEKAIDEC